MRSSRVWAGVAVLFVAGVVALGLSTSSPTRPLDPASTATDGSRALVHVLAGFGVRVSLSSSAAVRLDSATAVVVVDPDAYSTAQLRRFAGAAGRVVLVRPGVKALRALGLAAEPDSNRTPSAEPSCADTGAAAAGSLDLPGDAVGYDGLSPSCYGGLVGTADDGVIVLGSVQALQNGSLDHDGVAALDVNVITASRALREVVWLTPGTDAAGSGPASIWDLFPPAVYRAFAWALVIGVLVVLWRARRLGGVTREPLPVVVRAGEAVEGHGRLYERAAARDRAAAALQHAATVRLRRRLSLSRHADATEVAARIGTPAAAALTAATPTDDAALLRLAQDLDRLEEDVARDRRT